MSEKHTFMPDACLIITLLCRRPQLSEILRHLCELAHNYAQAGDPSSLFIASIEVLISQVLRHSSKGWPILIPQELVGDHSCGLEVDQFEFRLGVTGVVVLAPPHPPTLHTSDLAP